MNERRKKKKANNDKRHKVKEMDQKERKMVSRNELF